MTGTPLTVFRERPLGERGERHAGRFLARAGYSLLAGGHRTRYGEIDLIAVDHHGAGWPGARWLPFRPRSAARRRSIVFIEVKTRRSDRRGPPSVAVDAAKQRRLVDSALAYLKSHQLLDYPARFDVIAITWPSGRRRPAAVEHLKNAFQPAAAWQFYA